MPPRAPRQIVTADGDVTELASRPRGFAIEVDVRAGDGERVSDPPRGIAPVGWPDDVDGDDGGRGESAGSERPVEHGAEVLLELGGHAALDRVVAGVMGPERELVDDQSAARLEQLDREDAGRVDRVGYLERKRSRAVGELWLDRGGSEDLAAHAIALDRLDDGIGDAFSASRTGDENRELAFELQPGLEEQSARVLLQRLRGGPCVRQREDTPAVITAAWGLGDERPAVDARESREIVPRTRMDERRDRKAEPRERVASVDLVLGKALRGSGRSEPDPIGLERGEMLGSDPLVVEGDDVGAGRERPQVVESVRGAHDEHGARAHGRFGGVSRENAQPNAERDRRLVGHARELAGTDHRDSRCGVRGAESGFV